ncbi:Rho guanine nucleotide exchange factor 19 [Merluccius polli]|uniref:Rho guanine nucleotide exchange factor 19 n=1 Tax=Merluccius polli TaxID=89951 RepID=A0AA47N1M4_MERPO|nr:Rho guanine nucleotide exchange factor 19 [Merluccius polli]
MLPGYGFSPLPDFQPHINAFHCGRENPSMWIPGSGDSQALSEDRDGGPLLRPCHHKHVAVCRQETLAFIELQQPVTPKLHGSLPVPPRPTGETQDTATLSLPPVNGFRRTLVDLQNGSHGSDRAGDTSDSMALEGGDEFNGQTCAGTETFTEEETERPHAVTTVCRPLHSALSLPLSLPLSSFYTDPFESHLPSSPSSPSVPEGSGFQSPDSSQPQRRTSQGSLKEKSIRRKMRVYSPDSTSDESLSSPVDGDYIFPGPYRCFLEEDPSEVSSFETGNCPLLEGAMDLPDSNGSDAFNMPEEPLHIIEDLVPGPLETCGPVDTLNSTGRISLSQSRQVDHERRRFSASELISRLQLSQRKSSFTLKLGKSLSARVASRDRQSSSCLVPHPDSKCNVKQRCPGGSNDSGPHSPVGPSPPLATIDSGMLLHRWSTKLGTTIPNRMRKKSIEEDCSTPSTVASSNRLSRFLPSCKFPAGILFPVLLTFKFGMKPSTHFKQTIMLVLTIALVVRLSSTLDPPAILYQEYSDVAINREIQRQQGKEPGTDEEGSKEDGSDDCSSPSNLSPSSSFRSSRGSAFALWQDIPDVRTSGQLDNFSNEERKLQEAKFELVTSEASYIRSLSIVVDHFMMSQELAECLGAQDKQWLFSKLPEVKDVSERFLQGLELRLEQDILRFDVCDIVLDHCPALRRVYLPYVTNQAYQEQTYQRLLLENARFPGILARLEEDSVCQRLPLTSFLILPFQRITRLKMLVENILKRTTPGSRDEDTATKAFNELKKVAMDDHSQQNEYSRTLAITGHTMI